MTFPAPVAPSGSRRQGRSRGRIRQLAWAMVPVWSFGTLSFLPFLRLALARQRVRDWVVFTAYLVASGGLIAGLQETAHSTSTVIGGLSLALMGIASTHSYVSLRQLNDLLPGLPSGSVPAFAPQPNQRALQQAQGRIQRRNEAREIARTDPVLARELRIGRPDLSRDYDDGGLIDVNHVPVEMLAARLELTQQEAASLASARAKLGRFSSAEELSIYSRLPPNRLDLVRDLLWFG